MNHFVSRIERLKSNAALQIFTIYLRYLIGGAFIIAAIGMGKLSGKSFVDTGAPIGELMPIQQFFRVMAESGLYWNFIGWFQVVCGILLITQRFAKTGALLFFGMITNIFIITVSYHFQGTPIVTGLMTLAATYLLLWDAASLQFIFVTPAAARIVEPRRLQIHDQPYWSILGIIIVCSIFIVAVVRFNMLFALITPFIIGLSGFIVFMTIIFRKRGIVA